LRITREDEMCLAEIQRTQKEGKEPMVSNMSAERNLLCFFVLGILLAYSIFPVFAQNLGTAPQTNVAVQGQTGAQPEGAFLNFVNWVGNVIAPVGAGLSVVAAIVSYAAGRSFLRYAVVAVGLLAVSGLTRLLEYWINQGTAGVS
jgi:flagellar biosynthesis protein FlhB